MSPPDGKALIIPFLEHAARERLSMKWALHGHLLLWLRGQASYSLTTAIAQELLAAAAARWAHSDQSEDKGIILRFPELLPNAGVASWKSRSAREAHRVVLVRLAQPEQPADSLAVSRLADRRYLEALVWTPLPL